MCTITDAKVTLGFAVWLVQERNYNCYNVYFYECLQKADALHFASAFKTYRWGLAR